MTETIKQAKLVQYLSEAYAKEKELETALEADISVTTRKPYEKRLRAAPQGDAIAQRATLQRRIKKLGGRRPAADREGRRARGRQVAKASCQGPPARGPRDRRGREDAQEREDGVLQRARGDRHLLAIEDPRRERSATRRPRSSRGRSAATRSGWRSTWRGRSRADQGRRPARRCRHPSAATRPGAPPAAGPSRGRRRARAPARALAPGARAGRRSAALAAALDPLAGSLEQLTVFNPPRSGRATRARPASRAARRGSRDGRSARAPTPRWCTVLPSSSAAPYSVTITSTWWRGVVITAPALEPRHDPRAQLAVDRRRSSGRQSSERSDSSSAGAGDEVLVRRRSRSTGRRRSCRRRPGRGCRRPARR